MKKFTTRAKGLALSLSIAMVAALYSPAPLMVAAEGTGAEIVQEASKYIGVSYKYGGESPSEGFDNSGFVQYVFKQQGIDVPRSLSKQSQFGTSVQKSNLIPGDVVFFRGSGTNPVNVGIYIGNDKFLASGGGVGKVYTGSMTSTWNKNHYWGAKRFVSNSNPVNEEDSESTPVNEVEADVPVNTTTGVDGNDILEEATKLIGTPYKYGGESLAEGGFDNSGLIQYVFKQNGIDLPRTISKQSQMGTSVKKENLAAGDVVFFTGSGTNPINVGIYAGDNKFISSTGGIGKVNIRYIDSYLNKRFWGAKRYTIAGTQDPTPEPVTSEFGKKIIATGEKYLGTPYKWGSSQYTTETFDCSSFVQRVYKENGIYIPRGARGQAQAENVKFVARADLQVGDLVFFSTTATEDNTGILKIGHVGIYAGNGNILHTFSVESGGVKYNSMQSGWWDRHYVTARRVIH